MIRALLVCVILLANYGADTYKTVDDFNRQYKQLEGENFTTTDVLVGKAMDFMYSNRTIMNLVARELWNVGSRAIDKIVSLKGKPTYKNADKK